METFDSDRATIYAELTSDDSQVRTSYMNVFKAEVNAFADSMVYAMRAWQDIDGDLKGDAKKWYVAAFACAAVTLHITSMKPLLSGHIVAAGNLMRQVIESIAMAILCSAKGLDVLSRFMEGKYSTNDAVRDVLRQAKSLNLNKDGLFALKSSQNFYHKHSHISRRTLVSMISFSAYGTYIGASFDKGIIASYQKEVEDRISLAKVFPNILEGVRAQLASW